MLSKEFLFAAQGTRLTSAQEKIRDYLLEHPDDVAYMSSAELAQTIGISNATIVRFSQHFGFKGYLDLQRHIREEIKARLSVPQRVSQKPRQVTAAKDLLKTVVKSDQANLASVLKNVSEQSFQSVVEEIHTHDQVWVLGLRSCHGAAHYFATNLRFLSKQVNLITLDAGTVWSQIQHGLDPKALLLTISFPRYSRLTLDITQKFYDNGATIIALTDSPASPLAKMGNHCIYLPHWVDSFFESNVAVVSFLNAVLAGVSYMEGPRAVTRLQALEKTWEEQNVYAKETPATLPSWAGQFKTP